MRRLKLETLKEELSKWQTNRGLVVAIVYLSLVLDNMLLTVVVPIIPDYLYQLENSTNEESVQFQGVIWPQTSLRTSRHSDDRTHEQHLDPTGVESSQESLENWKQHGASGLRLERAMQQINRARHQNGARDSYVDNLTTDNRKNRREQSVAASKLQPRVVTRFSSFQDNQSSNNTVVTNETETLADDKENSDHARSSGSLWPRRVEVYWNNEDKDYEKLETDPQEEPEDRHGESPAAFSMYKENELPANSSIYQQPSSVPSLSPSFLTGTRPSTVTPPSPEQTKESSHTHPLSSTHTPADIINENSRVGLLFSSKAVVQLLVNPVVGPLTNRVGYTMPLFSGCLILLIAALLFAYAEGFALLFAARSLQGVASSCIAIAGMGVIADLHPDDQERGRVLGFVLGGIALGVLVGYPFGGLLYDFTNSKTTPFLALAVLIALLAILQLVLLHPRPTPCPGGRKGTPLCELLQDPYILVTAGSVMVSTSAIAILEPCLPIWLMDTLHPATWQLGTAFLPDSVGYLLGTSFFADLAFRFGRWRVAMMAMLLLAVSATLVPESTSMWILAVPHLGLGLGIGVVDSSLMPLLATLVDRRHVAVYGSVYAIAQTAVAFAYSLGPMVGGAVVRTIGFPWLMRSVAVANLVYCPLLLLLARFSPYPEETQAILLATPDPKNCLTQSTAHVQPLRLYHQHYQQLFDEED